MVDADVSGLIQGEMKISVDTLLPGRRGQVTPVDDKLQVHEEEI